MKDKRLTRNEFWEARHVVQTNTAIRGPRRCGRIRQFLDGIRFDVGAEPVEAYCEYLAKQVFRTYLPHCSDWKCIEIGCAPGHNLIEFYRMFGYQPFGVEYSSTGALQARETMISAGFDPMNIIEADAFDGCFQRKYANKFNVVFSRGFIEHFQNVEDAIDIHLNLLAPGGFLICTIPNLLGWGYPYMLLFARDLLKLHNCRIMRRNSYRSLFMRTEITELFCGYVGMFGLYGMSLRHERSLRGGVAGILNRATDLCDHFMFFMLRGKAIETYLSPSLVYIGRKVL